MIILDIDLCRAGLAMYSRSVVAKQIAVCAWTVLIVASPPKLAESLTWQRQGGVQCSTQRDFKVTRIIHTSDATGVIQINELMELRIALGSCCIHSV